MMRTYDPPRPHGETVFNVRCEGSMAALIDLWTVHTKLSELAME